MYEWIFKLGGRICHQIPERSLFVSGFQMPICSRCFSMYISVFATALVIMIFYMKNKNFIYFYFSLRIAVILSIMCSMLIIDGITSYLGIRSSNNILRVLTGVMFGVSFTLLTCAVYSFNYKNSYRICIRLAFKVIFISVVFSFCFMLLTFMIELQPYIVIFTVLLSYLGYLIFTVLGMVFCYSVFIKKVEV